MTLPNITVTAASASETMCLRADVKTMLNIASTDTSEDANIDGLIRVASLAIQESGLGRPPWLQTYLEKRPGDGGVYLYASRWPILSVTSVTIGTGDSPTTITAGDYSVAGRNRDRLYKAGEWNDTPLDPPRGRPFSGDRALEYNLTYVAGWVMPDEITEWTNGASVAANEWYKSTDADEAVIFRAGGSGTTDSTEPTWDTVIGNTTTDNDITWTAYQQRLPEDLEFAARLQAVALFGGALQLPVGIAEESFQGARLRYSEMAAQSDLTPTVKAICRRYR